MLASSSACAAHNAFLLHLQIAVQRGLVHGQIGRRGVHLVLLDIGLERGHVGLGGGQLRPLRIHLRHNLLLIQLRQLLALVHLVVDVHVELFHNAGGLRLHLDLGDRLNFSRGHHRPRHIAACHLGQLVGVNRRARTRCASPSQQQHHDKYTAIPAISRIFCSCAMRPQSPLQSVECARLQGARSVI